MFDVTKPVDELDRAKLVEAVQAALTCLTTIRGNLEDGVLAHRVLAKPFCWPFSLLYAALGDERYEDEAKANWNEGEYVGPVPEEAPAVPVDAAEVGRLVDDVLARVRPN